MGTVRCWIVFLSRYRASASAIEKLKLSSLIKPLPKGSAPRQPLETVAAFSFAAKPRPFGLRISRFSILCLCGLLFTGTIRGAPFKPKNDSVILETLRKGPVDATTREVRVLRQAHDADPANVEIATRLASALIARSHTTSDPRFLSYAEASLGHWWNMSNAPVRVLLLRATIHQSVHQFETALKDLDQVLQREPRNAQAWLIRETILQVTGDYEDASLALKSLTALSPGLITMTSAATLGSLTGDATNAYQILKEAIAYDVHASPEYRAWALGALAEIAVRLGKNTEADANFRAVLALDKDDFYTLGAYADFLLDQNRAAEVVPLLNDYFRIDALLLRVALAKKQIGSRDVKEDIETLRARFEALRRRGDTVHRREEAMFALKLTQEPARALQLAQENWQVQKEPADARILLETAVANRNREAAKPVLDWLNKYHVEDVRLEPLAQKLANPKSE